MARFKCVHTDGDVLITTPFLPSKMLKLEIKLEIKGESEVDVLLDFKSVERLHKKLGKFIQKVYDAETEELVARPNAPRTESSYNDWLLVKTSF